jgi:dTDP-4-amino-4,6-dideoxygalactose transaminase
MSSPILMSSPIPWASPLAQYRAHQAPIHEAINRVLDSGTYILGTEVQSFERAFANFCGSDHAVGVGSGTDALILALRSLGIGPGDDVITVSHTAVATVAAILACGATPVLVDVDPAYYTIDPVGIARAVTSASKAIIVVHLYGQPADLDAIVDITGRRGLAIIEDCAQAAGGRHRGRRLGTIGDVGCFSFYPTKNLGAIGDGGLVLTSDAKIAERVRRLRQYGWDEARETHEAGLNSRLDPLQAAILQAKLPHLDPDNKRRGALASLYNAALANLPLQVPATERDRDHVYHLCVVRSADRDRLQAHLAAEAISTAVHYPTPVHRQPGYAERVVIPPHGLPVTEDLAGQILSLPIYPGLSDDQANRVAQSIRHYYEGSR